MIIKEIISRQVKSQLESVVGIFMPRVKQTRKQNHVQNMYYLNQ